MSALFVTGLSHHSAPVEIREKAAVEGDERDAALRELVTSGPLDEALIISTCNRVELYAVSDGSSRSREVCRRFFAARVGERAPESTIYTHQNATAVQHAFRVAASLDSLVVGEPQILGQMKDAFDVATRSEALGPLLGRCFTRAFAVAKRVRTETAIAEGTVSVSSIAVELARKIFGDLSGRRALLIGAGEMGEAAARSLSHSGARLAVLNRSPEKASALAAACGGEARGYEAMGAALVEADVVISSTASERFILTRESMEGVVKARRHRPLFVIDIAVPRDVDPRVGDLDNVFLYDVDDLQQVAEKNLSSRRSEATAAEQIVESEVLAFESWMRSLELTPTIVALRESFDTILRKEMERTLPRLEGLDDEQLRALSKMRGAMVNKLLHQPLTELKRGAEDADAAALIATTRRLFALDESPARDAQEATQAGAIERKGASASHTLVTAGGNGNGEIE